MLRTRTTEPLEVRVEPHPTRVDSRIVTVLTPYIGLEPMPIAGISYQANAVEPLELVARGPGIFQAHVPIRDGFVVEARLPNDIEPTAAAGDDFPFPPELRAFGADREALARFADVGGGRVLQSSEEILANVVPAPVMRAMRLPLLLAALFVYLLGVLMLRWPERKTAAPVIRGAASPKKDEAPPVATPPATPPTTANRQEAA
jgi:hypothetical protein